MRESMAVLERLPLSLSVDTAGEEQRVIIRSRSALHQDHVVLKSGTAAPATMRRGGGGERWGMPRAPGRAGRAPPVGWSAGCARHSGTKNDAFPTRS